MDFPSFGDAFYRRSSEDREKSVESYRRLPRTTKSVSCSLLPSTLIANALPKITSRVISDAIIGLSDGLTVPFALTAGLSTLGETKVVIYGGLAELFAGAISMGLGGYLAAKSEEWEFLDDWYKRLCLTSAHRASYRVTLRETSDQVFLDPASIATSISTIFAPYDLPDTTLDALTEHISRSPQLPDFLMRFQHTLEEPSGSRALSCACTIAAGYFVGGFVPLLPYFFVEGHQVLVALCFSTAIMVVALFSFGFGKVCIISGWSGSQNIRKGIVGGTQMIVIGSVAAGSAMAIVRLFQHLLYQDTRLGS
jgi:VIT1/CCC1 family predicted Fe2+/Mn2+ transporter